MTQRTYDMEGLLASTDWLNGLAFSILRDAHLAEDVAQEVRLLAVQRGPSRSDSRVWRAWLATATRNLARSKVRSDARRERREADAAFSESDGSAAESLERVDAQRALVEVLAGLGSQDREMIVKRYFDGLTPREIAASEGIASTAVRSRLARALDRLRREFVRRERSHLSGLVALASRVTDRQATGLAAQGIGLGAATVLALSIVVVLLACFFVVFADQDEAGGQAAPQLDSLAVEWERSAQTEDELTGVTVRSSDRVSAVDEVPVPGEPVEPADESFAGDEVIVQAWIVNEAGEPVPGATLTATDLVEPLSVVADKDGRARLAIPYPMDLATGNQHWVFVEASADGYARSREQLGIDGPATVEAGRMRVVPSGALLGRVVGVDGAPVEGAMVAFVRPTHPGDEVVEQQRRVLGRSFSIMEIPLIQWRLTDKDGRYEFPNAPARSLSMKVSAAGCLTSYTSPLELAPGSQLSVPDLVLEPLPPENLIRGTVFDEEGPVGHASVRAFEHRDQRNVNPLASSRTGADGSFEMRAVRGKSVALECRHPESRNRMVVLDGVLPGGPPSELRLPSLRSVQVRLLAADGGVIEGAPHFNGAHSETHEYVQIRPEAHAVGEWSLNLPEGDLSLQVTVSGYVPSSWVEYPSDDRRKVIDIVLERSPVLRIYVDQAGSPVVGAKVHVHRPVLRGGLGTWAGVLETRWSGVPEGEPRRGSFVETGEDGWAEMPYAGGLPILLHAEAEGCARGASEPILALSATGPTAVAIELQPGASLSGRLLMAQGMVSEGKTIAISAGDGHFTTQVVGSNGEYRFEHLTPGSYQVRTISKDVRRRLVRGEASPVPGSTPADPWDLQILSDVTLRSGEQGRYDIDLLHEVLCGFEFALSLDGGWEAGWRAWARSSLDYQGADVSARGDGMIQLVVDNRPGPAEGSAGRKGTITVSKTMASGELITLTWFIESAGSHEELRWSAESGSVELFGLTEPKEEVAPRKRGWRYALVQSNGEGCTWSAVFNPDSGGAALLASVPSGVVEVKRAGRSRSTSPSAWTTVGTVTVPVGAKARFTE